MPPLLRKVLLRMRIEQDGNIADYAFKLLRKIDAEKSSDYGTVKVLALMLAFFVKYSTLNDSKTTLEDMEDILKEYNDMVMHIYKGLP